MNSKRQEFNLDIKGVKKYPLNDDIGNYRLQEIGQMSAKGMRGRKTMVFPIKGIMPNEGMQWKIGTEETLRLEAKGKIIAKNEKRYIIIRPEDESTDIFTPFW